MSMAAYNSFEKNIVRYLVDYRDNQLLCLSVLEENLDNVYFSLDANNDIKEVLELQNIEQLDLNRFVDQIRKRTIIIIHLLMSLINDHYILLFTPADTSNRHIEQSHYARDIQLIDVDMPDVDAKKWVQENGMKQIVVMEDLVELVNRDFKTQEQCNVEKSQSISKWSNLIAFIVGVGVMIVTFLKK